MSSEEVKTETGATQWPYYEASKRAAIAQWQSWVPATRVAEGLGITTESLRTWRQQFAGTQAESVLAAAGKLPGHRAERLGVGDGSAPTARAASEFHQPA